MLSRWRRRRQLRRTIRSHRAPRGWRPPPPRAEPTEPHPGVGVGGGPDEDPSEVTARQVLFDGGPTVRLAIGSRAAEVADEGWVAEPRQPRDRSEPRSGGFGRTVAWVFVGLLAAGMVALVLAGFWV